MIVSAILSLLTVDVVMPSSSLIEAHKSVCEQMDQ